MFWGHLHEKGPTYSFNMFLKHLSLVNYKNFDSINLEFDPVINCLVGNNGVGKTNILDAIYHLSFGKSYFESTAKNIVYNSPFFETRRSWAFTALVCDCQKMHEETCWNFFSRHRFRSLECVFRDVRPGGQKRPICSIFNCLSVRSCTAALNRSVEIW